MSFILVFAVFSVFILLVDLVELLRKTSDKDVPFIAVIEMVVLKLPMLMQIVMPFIILISAVMCFTSLARRSELVVIRSAGISAWEFLMPALLTAIVIGAFVVTLFNPLASSTLAMYKLLENKYTNNNLSFLEISDNGLWIKQQSDFSEDDIDYSRGEKDSKKFDIVIHAGEVSGKENVRLSNIVVYGFTTDDRFSFRVDAPVAFLSDKFWQLKDVMITFSDGRKEKLDEYQIPTILRAEDIQKSFADPEVLSFWELPGFIDKLSRSGFSALSHKMQWHKILSSPLFYAAMVLIGSVFSLKSSRHGKAGLSISLSIIFGFLIYFTSNLIFSLGLSGSLPVIIASWSPVLITFLAGIGILLHLEDG